jgi:hypothetical protein
LVFFSEETSAVDMVDLISFQKLEALAEDKEKKSQLEDLGHLFVFRDFDCAKYPVEQLKEMGVQIKEKVAALGLLVKIRGIVVRKRTLR